MADWSIFSELWTDHGERSRRELLRFHRERSPRRPAEPFIAATRVCVGIKLLCVLLFMVT